MKYKNSVMICVLGLGIAVLAAISFAESLQGCVKDETGQPVPYASVAVVGESKGTIAGENGCFTVIGLERGRSYTLRITSIGYLGFSGSAKTGEINSFTLRQDAIVVGEVVITARRPEIRAILRANIVNDAAFYGNSRDSTRKDAAIPIYPDDYIDFIGEESYYDTESQRITDEDFAWYFLSGYDADVFDDMIIRETPVQQYRNFLDDFKFHSPEKVIEGRKTARWQFREDPYQPFSKTSFAILEVRYLNGIDYDYGYYIQRINVDASNKRYCYPDRPCADTSRDAVYQPIAGICTKDSDCSPNVCDTFAGTCVPRNYEQRSCKITSNVYIYDRFGNRIENPFASPLFPQIASASPPQKAVCVSDTVIRVPTCDGSGVEFEEKACPADTKCVVENGVGVCDPIATAQSPYPPRGQVGFKANLQSSGICTLQVATLGSPFPNEMPISVGGYVSEGESSGGTYYPALCYKVMRCTDVIAVSDPAAPSVPCLKCGDNRDGSIAKIERSTSQLVVLARAPPAECSHPGVAIDIGKELPQNVVKIG